MPSRKALESPDSYTIAWIAALPIERAAAEAMLDEDHAAPTGFTRHQADANVYTWGRMGEHNIVIASLAPGVYGTTSAATTASSLLASLPSIRVVFLVGIGGGIARPDEARDIRLGDVVVSQPCGTMGGVCQYDLMKAKTGDKRERNGFLGRPPTVLLNALAGIQADHERKDSKVPSFLQEMLEKNPKMRKKSKQSPGYTHQGYETDRLFKASCDHVPGPDCRGCDAAGEVQRDPRDNTNPEIHYGIIASGNTLVKDAATRNRIVTDVGEDCICVEMEAAGLMNHFPCLVVRGICDYADSHKNDQWQRYASATAAAYTKELLAYVPGVEVQETKRALEVLQSVKQQIDGVKQTTVATKATADSIRSDLQTEKIRRWLSPPDPSTNANHARTLRYEGSGAWLLENPVFQSWKTGSSQHLWLHGLAGCGKTILSATVLDFLAKKEDGLILCFFFDFGDTTKRTLDGMLRSLAFQLYQAGVGAAIHLDVSCQAHQNGSDQPATEALWDIVSKMLVVQSKIYLILDALDESTTRDDIILWIKDVVPQPELVHVQLLCTSRPESEFLRHIPPLLGEQNCLALDKDAVNSDIRTWVTAQLSQRVDFKEKSLSQDLVERIQKDVGDGADGMFRWAFCQLESLARCPHEAAIEKALASLPRTLSETYQRMISNIPRELKHDAMRLLQFLVHTKRPLKLAEAKEVIATQIKTKARGFSVKRRLFYETDVLKYCPGLLTVVHATDKELHLAHFSVKEYLGEMNGFNNATASVSITKTCLTYLTDINGSHKELEENFPMARYAAEAWTGHAVLAQASPDIVGAIVKFLTEEATFQRWVHLFQADVSWKSNPGSLPGSRLYYACFAGLAKPARTIIHNGADVNAKGGRYGNALQAASWQGHKEVVRLLLDKGADINAQGGKYGNALQAASFKGRQDVVRLLSNKGANINAQGGEYGNALQAALSQGYRKIIRLLLDKGADINAQGGLYGNALQAASLNGHQDIVRLLLDKGADTNMQGGKYGNALQAASWQGHQEVVRLLLDKGADINAQGGEYGTALQAASWQGYQEVVRLLLDKGADINAQGGEYGTALQAASWQGHQEVVRLLLDKGADINAQGGESGNALQAASWQGHQEVVRLLLDKGADINAQGGEYGTALQAASLEGHHEVVRLLLDKGADINAQGGEYGTALQAASLEGHQEVVRLLLNKGADFSAQMRQNGLTPLNAASWHGCLEIVQLLLKNGADITTRDHCGSTPINNASLKGNLEVVRLLSENGAKIDVSNDYGRTPLFHASAMGHVEVVRFLLLQNALPQTKDSYLTTPLCAAVRNGHQEVANILFPLTDIKTSFVDSLGRNLCWWAARSGCPKIFELMQEHGSCAMVCEGQFEVEYSTVHPDKTAGWCSVCTQTLASRISYYRCNTCYDFDSCLDCYEVGVQCLDVSHKWTLVRHK